jgi:N-acyl-phosphatidylethanolamine-hydrolysing phospholipase D
VISHNHYDHLDYSSIKAIYKKFPKAKYFVPLGNKSWMAASGIPKDLVFELDWWQNREFNLADFGHKPKTDSEEDILLRFTCVPAQHNSGRGAIDQMKTLWCGWVVEQILRSKDTTNAGKSQRKGAIYHAGDTGYRRTARSSAICPVFKEIGKMFGPFDLSFLPSWRGGTLGFVSYVGLRLSHHDIPSGLHASPADAIDIHKDVMSRNSIGVHFGTFIGHENESYEAIIEFEEAREEDGVSRLDEQPSEEHGRAGTIDIGGSFAVEIGG